MTGSPFFQLTGAEKKGENKRSAMVEPREGTDGELTGDSVLVSKLKRVDDSNDLIELSSSGGGVGESESDDLREEDASKLRERGTEVSSAHVGLGLKRENRTHPLRVEDEDGSDGERKTFSVDVGLVQSVEHSVGGSDGSVLVTDDRELDVDVSNLVDVRDPLVVRGDIIGGEADD